MFLSCGTFNRPIVAYVYLFTSAHAKVHKPYMDLQIHQLKAEAEG